MNQLEKKLTQYTIIGTTIIFNPDFDLPIEKSIGFETLSKFDTVIFSNYDNYNITLEKNNQYDIKYYNLGNLLMGLLNKVFFKIGFYSASNPGTACFFSLMLTIVCSLGFINYRVTVS